ncbi:hypothetical protein NC652_017338 [Populus alba x Populus x berolinensis]|nr:hypothetical protein NC652_017338 [Populus alba x Populus x berolinensis]
MEANLIDPIDLPLSDSKTKLLDFSQKTFENRFLFKFTGKEDEINLLGDGSETPEFKDWAWLLPERVLELAVDFKKPVYEQVMKVFGPYLQADADEDSAAQNETEAEVYVESTPVQPQLEMTPIFTWPFQWMVLAFDLGLERVPTLVSSMLLRTTFFVC